MQPSQTPEIADDLRGLSSAVSLWLIVLVGAMAFYFMSPGHEILVQASESWRVAIRVLLAQAILVFSANRHLTDRARFFGARLLTALLTSLPFAFIAIAFWASAPSAGPLRRDGDWGGPESDASAPSRRSGPRYLPAYPGTFVVLQGTETRVR